MDMNEQHNHLARIVVFLMLILITWLMLGCKAKIASIETHTTDTIYRNEIVKIDKPQLNTIFIDNICDSLGVLKPIYYTSTSNNVRTTLKSDNNTLRLEVNVDSIVNSKVNEYKSSLKTKETVLIKYKNKKIMWYSLGLNLLLLGWNLRKPLFRLIKPI